MDTPSHYKPLGSVATLQRGYDLPAHSRLSGVVPVVSSGGVIGVHAVAKVRGPGVVTGRYGSIGAVFFVDAAFWPLNTTLYVKDFHGNEPKFIYYLLSQFNFAKFKGKTGVPGVNRNDLHKVTVYCPPVPEQRRAVSVLDQSEAAIDQISQLIMAKRRFKHGLMQKVLAGQQRFPVFRARPWNMHRLDYLCEELSNRNGSLLGPDSVMGVIKDVGFEPMRERVRGKGDLSRYKIVPPGAFAYNPMRLNIGSIAYNDLGRAILVSPDYEVFQARPGIADPDYVNELRYSGYWSSFMNHAGAGSVRVRIYFTDLARLRVPAPELDEQSRIAEVLRLATLEIEHLTRLHELTEDHKRALLSKLLSGGGLRVPA
jgi:type I restriction enzyme S subunit